MAATFAGDQRAYRLSAIDMLRGLVIVLMAIDHCRDFLLASAAQDPMANPDVPLGLFATRWITHFCAPVFVLLAGTSAGLMAARKSPGALGWFLLTRGVWLILIECLVISNGWTFAPGGVAQDGGHVEVILQVIWALGASMVALAAAQFLGRRACLALGAMIVLGHNLLDPVWPMPTRDEVAPLWVALHARLALGAGPFKFYFAYPLLPWIGVMLLGFGAAGIFELPAQRRKQILIRWGLGVTLAFFALRAGNGYGDPHRWQAHGDELAKAIMSFLNTNKYPPSLDYLLMTLGPAAIVCAYAEDMRGALKDALITLGRVPFAFYVAHIYLIHLLSLILGVMQGFDAGRFFTLFAFYPKGYGVPLPGVYLGWLLVLAVLYPFCRWVAQVKARRHDWWLSYL
jgi:uncharacterized membrane protein